MEKSFILLSLCLFLALAITCQGGTNNIQPGSCGQTSVKKGLHRIVGGPAAKAHSIPFIVSLRSLNGSIVKLGHFCGGTLIRVNPEEEESDIVLTAAHCLKNKFVSAPKYMEVALGAHIVSQLALGEERVLARKLVKHPDFRNKHRPSIFEDTLLSKNHNDIALIKLSRPVKFAPTIQPACLPASNENEKIAEGVNGTVAGWGSARYNGPASDVLKEVVVPVAGLKLCEEMAQAQLDAKAQFCASFSGPDDRDSCDGDSGGPYFIEGQKGYTVHGVVSYGNGCGIGGVYTRVSAYVDWIREQIQKLSEPSTDVVFPVSESDSSQFDSDDSDSDDFDVRKSGRVSQN